MIITLTTNDNRIRLVANSPEQQQNDVIEGKTTPEVLRKYADMLERRSELSQIAAQEYAKQEITKLTDIDVLVQQGKMSEVADRTKKYYGHDEYWAALYDRLQGELDRRHPKK